MYTPLTVINKMSSFYFSQQKTKRPIYLIVLISTIIAFVSLPFLFVELSFPSRGVIRSSMDNNSITTNISAKVNTINILENKYINKGDTLLELNTSQINERISFVEKNLQESKNLKRDLDILISKKNSNNLQTSLYRNQYKNYLNKIDGLNLKYEHYENQFKASKKLFENNAIAKAEYLKAEYDYDIILSEITNYKNSQLSQWHTDAQRYKTEIFKLKSRHQELLEERKMYIIKAPLSGLLINYSGLKKGNVSIPNQKIVDISPTNDLMVECFVFPKDIGFVYTGMPVSFEIDAFNSNQWGLLKGTVVEVFEDVNMFNNKPVFKVRCKLESKKLQLKSGFVGSLKKGMTLTGHFKILKRSLWDLLYDNIEDWLNPNKLKNAG